MKEIIQIVPELSYGGGLLFLLFIVCTVLTIFGWVMTVDVGTPLIGLISGFVSIALCFFFLHLTSGYHSYIKEVNE